MAKEKYGAGKSGLASMIFALLLAAGLFSRAAAATQLRTVETKPFAAEGTYTLMLYGCQYADDVENVAILEKEGGLYPFEIYAPDYSYKVKTGLSADAALKEAQQFIRCSFHYNKSQFSSILDPSGNIIGYEVRPLYSPIRFGRYDLLDIHYTEKTGKVVIYIRLDPNIERELRNEGGGDDRNGK